ncbi:acyltransferase-domain-containing protein [Pseudomassariella vexata]|uniref:Acyltransferase-domain-containing protein n=1 Tax=Pseudomassariella vexata TaxID=1141098 RepID=A0A1Y2EIH8_9PEZI|nr:acyltransferase-domain-containing protein [Pseudomassariella vexata]ORY71389.1 acyltransferase-domain-containing protein [Pseudomassariella vexata]
MTSELRQRPVANAAPAPAPTPNLSANASKSERLNIEHPSGKAKHSQLVALLRLLSFVAYFATGLVVIHITQFLGAPLYWINREFYYAYIALTKQSFGLLVTAMTHWWAPTVIRVSGDASVAGQLSLTPDGRIEAKFPERLVMIANHQIYTDWLYLWWVGYTNVPAMHGHLYIILKESLKYIPIIGPGCMFFGFIFLSRKMATDRPRLSYRLGKLKKKHGVPDDDNDDDEQSKQYYDPMWLLLFPEGTNLSDNGRVKSGKWAEKMGLKDMQHMMLPRSTGTFFCLNELKGTVDYVYDCTVAYEGVPRGGYGEEYFTLSSTYFHGRPPKSVNFYWRRFALADMPLHDQEEFDKWLRDRWYEKDALMEQYVSTGRFPANGAGIEGHIETEVRTQYWWEFLKIFIMLGSFVLIFGSILRALRNLAGK